VLDVDGTPTGPASVVPLYMLMRASGQAPNYHLDESSPTKSARPGPLVSQDPQNCRPVAYFSLPGVTVDQLDKSVFH